MCLFCVERERERGRERCRGTREKRLICTERVR